MKTLLVLLPFFLRIGMAFGSSTIVCKNEQFPENIGSKLEITLNEKNVPSKEAVLTVNDAENDLFKSKAKFYVLPPTFNEDGTTVNYFQWYAGSSTGENPSFKMPRRMVTYNFKGNYEHNKGLFLGIIEWSENGKKETHHLFNCQAPVKN